MIRRTFCRMAVVALASGLLDWRLSVTQRERPRFDPQPIEKVEKRLTLSVSHNADTDVQTHQVVERKDLPKGVNA